MIDAPTVSDLEQRLLILAPIGKDGALIQMMLRDVAVACHCCRNFEELAHELQRGAAALLVTEESVSEHEDRLGTIITSQPPWSDLPILLLTRTGADSAMASRALESLGNATLLERPVRVGTLTSAVRSALRARQRQYQARVHLEELRKTDQRKDQFLATLAHELRNPLAPIRNAIEILHQPQGTIDTKSVQQILDRQVNHMVRLVDDLLDVSRITRDRIELHRQRVDLAQVIATAVETSRPLIDEGRHRLTVHLPGEPLVLDADQMRLAQVFANLLNNAAKYTDQQGEILVTATALSGHAVVSIRDTGIGMSAQSLRNVFDIFTQADEHDRRGRGGLGVGLALAKGLVELHGGTLRASSPGIGQGSEFVVELPLSSSPATDISHVHFTPEIPERQRILIVDDNRDAADTLGQLLKHFGAEVQIQYDGHAALRAVEEFAPRVVILDLGMPGMDGYEVARQLRARRNRERQTIIALTGWGQPSDRAHTAEAGFDFHFIKPVNIHEMREVLAGIS